MIAPPNQPKPSECGWNCIICGPDVCPVHADFGDIGESEIDKSLEEKKKYGKKN